MNDARSTTGTAAPPGSMPQCVILAGGRGTRISEESHLKPKPMIEIGTRPLLWHLMRIYAHHGVDRFVICLGYRGHMIKEFFVNYFAHSSNLTVDLSSNEITYHHRKAEPWKVTLVDTGETTLTGGRIRRIREFLDPGAPFFLTYGDGLADVDVAGTFAFHRAHGRLATMTVVRPPARFGTPILEDERIVSFQEKAQAHQGYINGGFFVVSPGIFDHIPSDDTPWETVPLESLSAADQLRAWKHQGFWQAMDNMRDRELLEALWASGQAPWSSGERS